MGQHPQLGESGQQRASTLAWVTLATGLVGVVLFWAVLLVDDDTVFPFVSVRIPGVLIVGVAVLHVASAIAAWPVAIVRAAKRRAVLRLLFAAAVVPIAALFTLGVLLSDALVWRGDLWAWLGYAMMAAVGPTALVALFGWTLMAEANPRVK